MPLPEAKHFMLLILASMSYATLTTVVQAFEYGNKTFLCMSSLKFIFLFSSTFKRVSLSYYIMEYHKDIPLHYNQCKGLISKTSVNPNPFTVAAQSCQSGSNGIRWMNWPVEMWTYVIASQFPVEAVSRTQVPSIGASQ